MSDETRPALYCGTYAKYNNGSIAGAWLYLDDYKDTEQFFEACKKLHENEHDPEYMFQDFEGIPKSLYSESLSTIDLEKIYEWVALDEEDRDKVKEYWDENDSIASIDSILDMYEGNINDMKDNGWMSNEEAYGYYCVENGLIDVPEHLSSYFDYEGYGRDQLYDTVITDSGYIFRNC